MRNAMKPIALHPASVLAGLAVAGTLALVTGASQSPGNPASIPIHDVRLVGEIPAEWWTYMQLNSTQPSYMVPADRYFVVTAWSQSAVLADEVNTAPMLGVLGAGWGGLTRVPFPPNTVLTTTSSSQLWGYLEPVR
jgi:hypothetical protein